MWYRSLVLHGAFCLHLIFSASAVPDPPSAQKWNKMLKCVGAESRGYEAGVLCAAE